MARDASPISLDEPPINGTAGETSLWQEILKSASRHGERLPAKHVLVLGERNSGKSTLIEYLFANSPSSLYSFTSDPSASTSNSHYSQASRAKSKNVSSFLRQPPTGRDGRTGTNAGGQLGRKVVAGSTAVGGRVAGQGIGSSKGGVNGMKKQRGKGDEAEEVDDEDDGQEVLLDDRLKKTEGIVVDYEWVDVNDGDIENVPPLSFYIAPSSSSSILDTLPSALPDGSVPHTAILIVLDWTKPHLIASELARWLAWVDDWSATVATRAEEVEGHDKLQSHLQHYAEPKPVTEGQEAGSIEGGGGIASTYKTGMGSALPLGNGVLTHNKCGIPITIVITKSDRLDSIGDDLVSRGMIKGKGLTSTHQHQNKGKDVYAGWNWDERVDWAMAGLRVAGLMYGASVFFTTTGRPDTFALLRKHLLHRLYTIPPPLHAPIPSSPSRPTFNPTSGSSAPSQPQSQTRFPFPHRANQLDRDAIMIPSGWDSWGKIKILREGFESKRVNELWEVAIGREREDMGKKNGTGRGNDGLVEDDDEEEGIEKVWGEILPDASTDALSNRKAERKVRGVNEQDFLSRQLEALLKDPNRDPRRALRHAALSPSTPGGSSRAQSFLDERLGSHRAAPGVVGPIASDGLSMPNVESAFATMEGRITTDVASAAKQDSRPNVVSPSPAILSPSADISPQTSSNEVLNNFFQGLIAGRRTPSSTPVKSPNPTDTKS